MWKSVYLQRNYSQVFLFPHNVNHPMISTTPGAWHPAELSEYQFLAKPCFKTTALPLPCCSSFWSYIWVSAPAFPSGKTCLDLLLSHPPIDWNLQFSSSENWSHLSGVAEIGKGFWDSEEKGQQQTSNILLINLISRENQAKESLLSKHYHTSYKKSALLRLSRNKWQQKINYNSCYERNF